LTSKVSATGLSRAVTRTVLVRNPENENTL
jgi:hypothetical protein